MYIFLHENETEFTCTCTCAAHSELPYYCNCALHLEQKGLIPTTFMLYCFQFECSICNLHTLHCRYSIFSRQTIPTFPTHTLHHQLYTLWFFRIWHAFLLKGNVDEVDLFTRIQTSAEKCMMCAHGYETHYITNQSQNKSSDIHA